MASKHPPHSPITIAILAGGKSSRFGANKAIAKIGNKTFISTIIETAKKVSSNIKIVSSDDNTYQQLGVELIPDILPGAGPLGGLLSVIKAGSGGRIFLLACDMPCVSPELITFMTEIPTWAPAVIPVHQHKFEPLHAIYHSSLEITIEYLLKAGKKSMRTLIDLIPRREVTTEQIMRFSKDLSCLNNINTQEDLKRLLTHTFR